MDILPLDIIYELMLLLPYKLIINLGFTNKYYYSIIQDYKLWATKAHLELAISYHVFYQSKLKPIDIYLSFKFMHRHIERFFPINQCLHYACFQGDLSLVNYFIKKGATDLTGALCWAIPHRRLINLLLFIGAEITTETLVSAVHRGNEDLFDFLLLKSPNHHDFKYIFRTAIIHNRVDMLKPLITNQLLILSDDLLTESLKESIESCSYTAFIYLIDKGAKVDTLDLLYSLKLSLNLYSCYKHHQFINSLHELSHFIEYFYHLAYSTGITLHLNTNESQLLIQLLGL